LARSRAKVARSREAIERSQAILRREEAKHRRERERARREYDALASQLAHLQAERRREQRETAMQARAAREQARRLRGIAHGTVEQAASILNDIRAVRQQAPAAIRSAECGQERVDDTTVLAELTRPPLQANGHMAGHR
jgi:hypothetical protein